NNIHSFTDQEIEIVKSRGGNKIDKLQLSYDHENGSTTINVISNDKATSTEITEISSIKNPNDLLCLHDKSGQQFLVKKIDMLMMGIALKPGKEVPLKQFFVDNNIRSFQDRAIPARERIFGCKMYKMSYDANPKFKGIDPNDGVSIGIYDDKADILNSEYDPVSIELIKTGVVFLNVQDENCHTESYSFRIPDLRNFVNSLKENTDDFEQNGEPINTFFLEKFIPGQKCNLRCAKTIYSGGNSNLEFVNIKWYGNNCLHCSIYDKRTKSWHGTQNVRIECWSDYSSVDIFGQYLTNENTWKDFNVTVKYDELQNLECFGELAKRHSNYITSSYTVPVGEFLKRNNALPPKGQTRSITAIQQDWAYDENHKREVQVTVDHNGNLIISGDTYDALNLTCDGSCKENEAIIIIHNSYSYDYKY
ncbi:MAG: hypothetical protein K2L13_01710, partial [Opitutales bacterium]|nr:hypothetical protein [Opitutales bacterium]